jgi:hypothetical protein
MKQRDVAVEELELASARLEWARAASCDHLRVQREALDWHVACCESALDAIDRRGESSGA